MCRRNLIICCLFATGNLKPVASEVGIQIFHFGQLFDSLKHLLKQVINRQSWNNFISLYRYLYVVHFMCLYVVHLMCLYVVHLMCLYVVYLICLYVVHYMCSYIVHYMCLPICSTFYVPICSAFNVLICSTLYVSICSALSTIEKEQFLASLQLVQDLQAEPRRLKIVLCCNQTWIECLLFR